MAAKSSKRTPPPLPEESGRTILEFVEEHRKALVAIAVLVGVAILGTILYVTQLKRAHSENWASMMSTMGLNTPQTDLLLAIAGPRYVSGASQVGLEDLVEDAHSDMVPHVLWRLAISRGLNEDYDLAIEALDRLRDEFGDHPLNGIASPNCSESLVQAIRSWLEGERDWEAAHAFEAPDVNRDRVALVETDKGAFWLGFYPEMASKRVEGFIARALKGGFNGTSVTEIERNHVRFGGDTSNDDDPRNDDEAEAEGLLASDTGRFRIPQAQGAVSAVAVSGGESPTRFDIVTGTRAGALDKSQTVFAQVLLDEFPGFKSLDEIQKATTYATTTDERLQNNSEFYDILSHPVETIRILRVSIWAGGKITDGHDWDVSTVVAPVKGAAVEAPNKVDEDK